MASCVQVTKIQLTLAQAKTIIKTEQTTTTGLLGGFWGGSNTKGTSRRMTLL